MKQWPTIKMKLVELKPAKYNPRTISERALGGLANSIERFGLVQPIVWNKRTGNIVGGHQRYRVLVEQGAKDADVVVVDIDENEEVALNIALNNPTIQGEFTGSVEDLLKSLKEKSEDLFEKLRMGDLAERLELSLSDSANRDKDAAPRLDEAEELRKKWKTDVGQMWVMGEHKILCGDCTQANTFERLMGDERAQMAVTSPPYGVGKSYEQGGIQPWFDTIKPCIQHLCKYCGVVVWQLGDLYKTGGQFIEPTMVYSMNMFMEQGFRPIWIRIWEKQGINFGTAPYYLISNKPAQQYEQIVAVASEESIKDLGEADMLDYEWVTAFAGRQHRFVKRLTRTERKLWGYSGVWKINTVKANDKHPAMFPVELPKRCILMHSDKGGIVLEPFDGSGTTIVACENTGRRCRAIELDPKYVAVALQRYEDAFEQHPRLTK